MSLQVEQLEHNMAKLTIEVSAEELEGALQKAYQKQKSRINVPGFRKGKVPRQLIEKMYGPEIFYDDAANALIPEAYSKAYDESGLEIVSQPKIDVTQIEKGKPFIFTAEVATKPEVELGEYKGIEVPKYSNRVTQKEIDAKLEEEQLKNARTITVEGRPVQDKDEVVLDFEGFVDGEAFEGGKGENYPLTIGSGSFIPGFEEQLIGAEPEKEVEVKVTFPEDYHAEDLKGQPVVFKVKVNAVQEKELPALDDEFAKDVSEFDTLDELKKDIESKILDAKNSREDSMVENKLLEQVVEGMTVEVPDCMIENRIDENVEDFSRRLQYQGMDIKMYMQYTGMDEEGFRKTFRESAEKQVKTRLALEAVAKAENLTASEEELEEEYKKIADMYKIDVAQVKAAIPQKGLESDITANKAIDVIKSSAVIENVEKKEEKAKKAPAKKAAAKKADDGEKTEEKKPAAKKTTAKKTAAKKTEDGEKKPVAKKTAAKKPAAKKTAAKKEEKAE